MIYLKQTDPQWANKSLGTSVLKVGRGGPGNVGYGCTTCCVSMLSDYFGCYRDPGELAWRPTLYTPGGLLLWTQLNKVFPKMEWVWREYGFNRGLIEESINNKDKAVILEVPAGSGKHWVVAVRKTWLGLGSDYVAIDPLTGGKINVLAKYGRITGSAHFERVGS